MYLPACHPERTSPPVILNLFQDLKELTQRHLPATIGGIRLEEERRVIITVKRFCIILALLLAPGGLFVLIPLMINWYREAKSKAL